MVDILLIGNDVQMLQETKESLERSFSMKDLGEATYILESGSIEIDQGGSLD